jgi:hypothetical protein
MSPRDLLVTGTSQATVIALATARLKALGAASRYSGIQDATPLAAYGQLRVLRN